MKKIFTLWNLSGFVGFLLNLDIKQPATHAGPYTF